MTSKVMHSSFDKYLDDLVDASNSTVSRQVLAKVLVRALVQAPLHVTRSDIAKGEMMARKTELNPGVVSKAVRALVHEGFLTEGELRADYEDRAGRPIKRIQLGSERFGLMGIKVAHAEGRPVGLTGVIMNLRLDPEQDVLVSKNQTLPAKATFDTIDNYIGDFADDLIKTLREVDGDLSSPREILCLGVEVAGHVHEGRLMGATHVGLPPTKEYDLLTPLQERLGFPVVIDNDVNVLGVRELYRNKYNEADLALVAVFEDGVGATLILGGHLYRGGYGMAAEPGHQRVTTDRIQLLTPHGDNAENMPSGPAPLNNQTRRFEDACHCGKKSHVDCYAVPARIVGELDSSEPFEDLAKQKALDSQGRLTPVGRAFQVGGDALGQGIAAIINIVNPSRVVLILPPALSPDEPNDESSAGRYIQSMEQAVNEYSFSRGAENARAGSERITIDPLAPSQVQFTGAYCAAIRAFDAFIAHARGRDHCQENIAAHAVERVA